MILSGLTSNTFPSFAPKRIIELCQAAGLKGIEWQEHPHVPVGDLKAASHARAVTEEAGMVVISYAVDKPVGRKEVPGEALSGEELSGIPILIETAGELGAEALRIRAGDLPPNEMTDDERTRIAGWVSSCVDRAEKQGLLIAIDLHPQSLTPTGSDALELMRRAGVDTAHVFWSPQDNESVDTNIEDLTLLRNSVLGLHGNGVDETLGTTMLSELTDRWARYLSVLRDVDDDHWFCLRGVEGNTVENFYRDAQTLRRLAAKYGEE